MIGVIVMGMCGDGVSGDGVSGDRDAWMVIGAVVMEWVVMWVRG